MILLVDRVFVPALSWPWMIKAIQAVVVIAAFTIASGQVQQPPNTKASVKAEIVDANGVPVKSAFLELRPVGQNRAGVRTAASPTGGIVISSLEPRKYDLSIQAGGFNTLSQTIEIDSDKDLGRIAMDADPNVLHVSGASVANVSQSISIIPGLDESTLTSAEKETHTAPVPVSETPLIFRGQIEPSSAVSGRQLAVQVSCSEQRPGMAQRPQRDVARVPVSSEGIFEDFVPACSGDTLAHRELRFSLKDESGVTIALLLPKNRPEGYHQSRIGISLPLKPFIEQMPVHEATFVPEFTDNRPLRAKLSVSPWKESFLVGETVFLNATLTNTSDEVLSIASGDVLSNVSWTISDDKGYNVPAHLFRDRTEDSLNGGYASRSHILFPGGSETNGVNVSLLFALTSSGTYHAVARQIVRRPEVLGEQQITSAPSTFVIEAKK
jgi:hypothetical protein